MKNKELFEQICSKDVEKLLTLISKGYEETSEFEECVLKVSDSLAMLHQAMTFRGKNESQKSNKEQVCSYKPYFRVLS